jgi:hypothetical protein
MSGGGHDPGPRPNKLDEMQARGGRRRRSRDARPCPTGIFADMNFAHPTKTRFVVIRENILGYIEEVHAAILLRRPPIRFHCPEHGIKPWH